MARLVFRAQLIGRINQASPEVACPDAVDACPGEVGVGGFCHPAGQDGPVALGTGSGRATVEEDGLYDAVRIGDGYRAGWHEEGGLLPELLLLPPGKGVVVALGALDLDSQEVPA